jgi:aminoglycoside N3'-acetyltransferase
MVCLVHTDISKIELGIIRDNKYGTKPQNRALNYLRHHLEPEELWFPAYNYDFGKTKIFNPKTDGTSVGAINSAALELSESIRTLTPIYSYVGFGRSLAPNIREVYRPFNTGSELQELLNLDAEILFYGASFSAFTFLHYIEEKNQINYRYLKKIDGQLQIDDKSYATSVELKVRPLGKTFNYDWEKIESDLRESKVIRTLKKIGTKNSILKMSESLESITKRIDNDPYYLLDGQTKEWIIQLINNKKRPLLVEDFEEQSK